MSNYQPSVLAFAGSSRAGSYNKKLIRIAVEGAREAGAEVTLIDLKDFPLPLFDWDLEAEHGLPENGRKLKDLFIAHDGLMIASPEYNRSLTGLLKNTIDWMSRPVTGQSSYEVFLNKAAVIMSASPGSFGGTRSLIDLRKVLSAVQVLVLSNEVSITMAGKAFAEDGRLLDEKRNTAVRTLGLVLTQFLRKIHN
jgi:NAD(P)H-dependent FMN reductase